MSLKRGPYKSKPPASSPRAYRGRRIVALSHHEMCDLQQNFLTALVKAFVKDKLKRKTLRQELRRTR